MGVKNVNFGLFKPEKFDETYSKNCLRLLQTHWYAIHDNGRKNSFTLVNTGYFHTNDIYLCIEYAILMVLSWTQVMHGWTQVHSAQLHLTIWSSYIMIRVRHS